MTVTMSVLERVGALTWATKPLGVVDAGAFLNSSFIVDSGMNVTVSVNFGDGKSKDIYLERANNTVIFVNYT